ncbi:MAG: hypothetical protein IIC02_05720 [Planctomycetes bacterium]|nr:hypothetical protein [Planctomycetota bacterium]
MRHEPTNMNNQKRRGMTIVFVVVLIPVLLGAAALTIDVGLLVNTKTDLQIAADAAALAGVSALSTDEMMRVRMREDDPSAMVAVTRMAERLAARFSSYNPSLGTETTYIDPKDITVGWIDLESGTSPIVTDVPPSQFNAVQTIVRRTHKSRNGPVELLFARIFGIATGDVTATATAVFDDRVAGLPPSNGPTIWPFSINETVFLDSFKNGGDQFGYDDVTDSVSGFGDGINEIHLFPNKSAPGNFGTLNFGGSGSSSELVEQIDYGLTPEDIEAATGSTELNFLDDEGDHITYEIFGNTGISATMEDNLQRHIGKLIGFFVHTDVDFNGSNAIYTLERMVFGRLMSAELTGGEKGIWIQPVTIVDQGANTTADTPSSNGMIGHIMLAR